MILWSFIKGACYGMMYAMLLLGLYVIILCIKNKIKEKIAKRKEKRYWNSAEGKRRAKEEAELKQKKYEENIRYWANLHAEVKPLYEEIENLETEANETEHGYFWVKAAKFFDPRTECDHKMVPMAKSKKAFLEIGSEMGFPPLRTLFEEGNREWKNRMPNFLMEGFMKNLRECTKLQKEELIKSNWRKAQEKSDYDLRPVESERGTAGEANVQYLLNWWAKTHNSILIEKNCRSKYSDSCIRLVNWDAVNEPQEFDHILVTPVGVLHIETKEYSGDIEIVDTDTWKRFGNLYTSPAGQVRRHEYVLKSIVGDVNTIGAICLADEKTGLSGEENSEVPVFSIRSLDRSLDKLLETEERYNEEERERIARLINDHKISR